jgi:hypothetical protein
LTPINDSVNGRLLQSNGYGPIRINYIYNTTDIDNTTTLGKYIYRVMDIIQEVWGKIIEVDYYPSLSFNVAASQDRNNFACLDFQVSAYILNTPIPNKDFGILV